MLVCNVSLRPARTAIVATLAEAVTATDATTTDAVFAALIDDPATGVEIVDAYLGQIMVEAASAVDSVGVATSGYTDGVDETASAADIVTIDASVYTAVLAEAATSADDQDATVTGAVTARHAMLAGVFVNSDGTSREANVDGIMVNL